MRFSRSSEWGPVRSGIGFRKNTLAGTPTDRQSIDSGCFSIVELVTYDDRKSDRGI